MQSILNNINLVLKIVFIKTFDIIDTNKQESKIKRKMSRELEEIRYFRST